MDVSQIEQIITECYNKGDMSLLSTLLTKEERYDIFTQKIKSDFLDDLRYIFINDLLTEEEVDSIFLTLDDIESKTNLFMMLSDKMKIMVADEVELDSLLAARYVESIKDQRIKYRMAMHLLVNNKIDEFVLDKVIKLLDEENKKEFFGKVIEYYNLIKKEINSINIEGILKSFNSEERFNMLKLLFDKSQTCRVLVLHIPQIISQISDNDKIDCLNYLIDKLNQKDKYWYGLENVMNAFPDNLFNSALKNLLDKNIIAQHTFVELIKTYDISKAIEIIDYVIEYTKEKESVLVTESAISTIIEKASKEDGIKIFEKYGINGSYNPINIATNCVNIENRYFYIDYLISKNLSIPFDKINIALIDTEKAPSKNSLFEHINSLYEKEYKINRSNLEIFIEKFGYTTLKFIDSEKIKDLLKLDAEQLNKFLNIFDLKGTRLTKDDINTICNSFLQRQFKLENSDDYNIFSVFEDILRVKDADTNLKITELLLKINKIIDINVYLEKNNTNIDNFIEDLINNNKDSLQLLHDITQEYIMKKREEYVKEKLDNIFDKLHITKKAEKSFYKKKLLETNNVFAIISIIKNLKTKYLLQEEIDLINNSSLLKNIVKFKKQEIELDQDIKNNLKTFESILNKIYEYQYSDSHLENITDIPYTYYAILPTDEDLLNIIVECDIKRIVEQLNPNEELYNELIATIQKYKLLGWHDTFDCFEDTADITFNNGTMASIITYFDKIKEYTSKNNANLTTFLDYANCFDSVSKTYNYLLGKDNYRLIAANEGKNKSNISKVERIKRIPLLVKGMYERKEITTPPIDKDYETTSGKKINVVMGNSTNMINLSYGERTSSCLRIGGAFNNLFEFCIHNKNGFHVRFTDPNTNEFITRVSGIRNGNTIFFNELRLSENESYSDEDVIEVLKKVSEELIDKTKDEECPIENVVISYDYAMIDYKNEAVPANLKNYPDAFFGLRFNINLDGNLVVLKTTNNNKLVPYKFGSDLPKTYEPKRDKVMYYDNKEKAKDRINQIYLINGILGGLSIEEIEYEVPENIIYFVSGEDWFIYVDDNNIHKYIMENSKQKEKAIQEVASELEKLNKILQEKEMNNITIGGLS